MVTFTIFGLVGKIIIFLLQKFPKHSLPIIKKLFREGRFLDDLFSCGLCLGFWVYSGLAFLFDVNVIGEMFYVPILSEFITGAVMTFIVYLISAGWNSEFTNYVIE
jgi:hypothetical protein